MGDVRAISLSSFQTEILKEFKQSGKKYILNGKNNKGYNYVIDRYKYSPTNSAILDSYYSFIYGKGLTANYTVEQAGQMATVLKLFKKQNGNPPNEPARETRTIHDAVQAGASTIGAIRSDADARP